MRKRLLSVLIGMSVASGLSGCAAWEAFKVPFDKFSYAMSGESRHSKQMEKHRAAVEWEQEYEALMEQGAAPAQPAP